MADKLNSGGSSEFLEARKYFYPQEQRLIDRVEIFVEDEVDSAFWRYFLEEFTTHKEFTIRVLRTNEELNGKDALISRIGLNTLGPNKLIAIDSDYDYIIDNYHAYTNDLRNCPYVIHTIDTYSIENYKVHPVLLRRAIYMCSFCDLITEDIDNMLYSFSQSYYHLFAMHLFLMNKHDNQYTQSKFKADLHKLQFNGDLITQNTLDYISSREKIIKQYISQHYSETEYNNFIVSINNNGVSNNTCWQYMNGHDILEKVAIKITQSISSRYRNKYIEWVHSHISQKTRKDNLLKKFYNTTGVGSVHQLRDRLIEIFYDFPVDFRFVPAQKTQSQLHKIWG